MNALSPVPETPATRTTCPYCGVGCGVIATPDGMGGAAIAGDAGHPANLGRLCSKGSALGETLGLGTRLLHPKMLDASGKMQRTSWDAALDCVARGFAETVAKHGPDSVAFYLSGQLLTEDYYAANKLMKGFIGTANVDTNSRLCMASSVAGHRRAFGSDTVPGSYEDLDRADLLVLVGSNAAWCHPVLFQRMQAARETRGAKLIVIDPRGTATGEAGDLHLAVRHGSDSVLFSGLLAYLADNGAIDPDFVGDHTEGLGVALDRARTIAPDLDTVAAATGLSAAEIASFYALWAGTQRVVTLYSQGVNQSSQGTDKVNAIINCHLATGRIGREGMGPFSLTGQPNAMGGREVGGLANQLAAHMGFSPAEVDRVRRYWNAPNMASREGLKAVQLFEAIERGEVKALWVMGTNPAVSLPRADAMRAAMRKLDLLVVSENVASTDTTQSGAHVLLPAAAWGEKDGTVTNSERRISRQRGFLPLAGEAMPDWWAVSEVARRLGFGAAFDWTGPAAIFREHAALSAFENEGTRDFDLSGLTELSNAAYDAMSPVQWPVRRGDAAGQARLFAEGGFFTPNRRARFIAIDTPRISMGSPAHPLILNTGRMRDQWHTMTRTGLSPRLASHRPEPVLAVNPADADAFGLADGGLARVASTHGSAVLRVDLDAEQARGSVFAPIHWNDETAGDARVGALVHPATDPHSGQPDAKATPVSVSPVAGEAGGFILSRRRLRLPGVTFWAWCAVDGGFATRLDGPFDPGPVLDALRSSVPGSDIARYRDEAADVTRAALLLEDRLEAVFYTGPGAPGGWTGLARLWAAEKLSALDRLLILSGESGEGVPQTGPIVCACFGVGEAAINEAIAQGACGIDDIGRTVKAGTNCGSCLPELKKMLKARHAEHAS